jgi:hypothetical protein
MAHCMARPPLRWRPLRHDSHISSWRVEVNARLHNQNRRIDAGLRYHELTRAEAQQLRSEDRGIYQQECIDAAGDQSRIAKAEPQQLNGEENAVSGQIHR